MVRLAPGGGDRAALRSALLVADDHGFALRRLEQSRRPAQVEDLGPPAQDCREDGRRAGEAAYLPSAEVVRRPELAAAETVAQRVERHRDDHRGRVAAVHREAPRVTGLQQRAERLPAAYIEGHPVALPHAVVA